MKLSVLAAATVVASLPAAPALAHCRTVHHRIHRIAWHAPVRRHVAHYASCACRTHVAHRHVAYRRAAYPVVYRRPRVVEVTYERPFYRPAPIVYAEPIFRPRPFIYGHRFYGHRFYGSRFGGGRRLGFERGFERRGHRWGGWR